MNLYGIDLSRKKVLIDKKEFLTRRGDCGIFVENRGNLGRFVEISGQFDCSLDDKGRLLLPMKLREGLAEENSFVLTRGVESCLVLYGSESWATLKQRVEAKSSQFVRENRLIQRRIIAPAEVVSPDKSGRLKISGHFCSQAGLAKDCLLIGLGDSIEIWSPQRYAIYEEETAADLAGAWEMYH